jgi:hypothetical protein
MADSDYDYRLVDAAPKGSVLEQWETDGRRTEPSHSNIVSWISPDEDYLLTLEVDDPIEGWLLRLYRLIPTFDNGRSERERIGMTIEQAPGNALDAAARLAAAADELYELHTDPDDFGPRYLDMESFDHPDLTPIAPDEWTGSEEEWEEAVIEARDKAGQWGKPSLTTKTIDGRDYYYLQWREGDRVSSQYVAPVDPK